MKFWDDIGMLVVDYFVDKEKEDHIVKIPKWLYNMQRDVIIIKISSIFNVVRLFTHSCS